MRREKIRIVATKLPKMGGKKRERERIVATKLLEMRGEKKDLGQKLKGKKIVTIDLWQWNYRNGRKKK